MTLCLDGKILIATPFILIASGFVISNHFQDLEVVRPNPDYCNLQEVNIDGSAENISARNVGTVNLVNLTVEWRNSSGIFSEEIESLKPAESEELETGQFREVSVRTSMCNKILAEDP